MLAQKIQLIKNGKLKAEENIKNFIHKIRNENKKYNIVLHLNEQAVDEAKIIDKKIKQGKAGKLAGLGFLVKSNINVKGMICNCASKTLENYKSGFNATVIKKLKNEDAIVLGMVNMDEFACGSSGETSAFGVTKNPRAPSRIPGGSSSGSAAAIAAEFCDFSLGSDTGGSIRNPASHCGVVGMKPSYGAVSRYGLIDLSMSLDQIGPLAKSSKDASLIFSVIKGKDEYDAMSQEVKDNKELKNLKIGLLSLEADKEITKLVENKVKAVCQKNKWTYKSFSLPYTDIGIQTYYPIAYTEFYSGTRKFDGRKYGFAIEETCGKEVLRRIIGGEEISKAEFTGRYYQKALQAKKLLQQEFAESFEKFDLIITPTIPRLPHKFGEKISIEDMYNYDVLTVLANIAEFPAISIPCNEIIEKNDSIPIGMQLMAAYGHDNFLLNCAQEFE
ncbi:aspartyl/glutamyl-tRNA amidotransferase subunit A [Candidatus Pacearchaeota archaeon]|nr:aspartyl/glutamyl-tRNA amidotransferase subunit A [Candidatus Pacearchaeota archaeon]